MPYTFITKLYIVLTNIIGSQLQSSIYIYFNFNMQIDSPSFYKEDVFQLSNAARNEKRL